MLNMKLNLLEICASKTLNAMQGKLIMRLHLTVAVSQGFDFCSTDINFGDIREKIATFIVSQIIEQNGEFHAVICQMDETTEGDEEA